MSTYYTAYAENPDGFVSDTLHDWVREYNDEFRDYWALDSKVPPEDLEEHTWKALKLLDQAAANLITSARHLQPEDKGLSEILSWLREQGFEPTELRFFRQRFELALAQEHASEALNMADRALALTDLLMHTESERAKRYLRRVADCYIRGLATETVIMCGAALEAALEEYVSDSEVREAFDFLQGRRHVSPGHRVHYLEEQKLLAPAQLEDARALLDERNEAIHVAPGLEADPKETVERLARVLEAFKPPEWEEGTDSAN